MTRWPGRDRRCEVTAVLSRLLAKYVPAVLPLALGILSVHCASYTPRWRVGDWWVTRSSDCGLDKVGWRLGYPYRRYDITRMATIDGQRCYVVQIEYRHGSMEPGDTREEHYVSAVDWAVLRQVTLMKDCGEFGPVLTWNFPHGRRWPGELDLCLPWFPVDGNRTTETLSFQNDPIDLYGRRYLYVQDTRAESSSVVRCLEAGDAPAEPVLRPSQGIVYSCRLEAEAPPDSATEERESSVQLWCAGYPWRLYDERRFPYSGYEGIVLRSWLIACGHSDK